MVYGSHVRVARFGGGLKTPKCGDPSAKGSSRGHHADAGAVGAILAFACPAPTACYEIYAAWKEGDAELARIKQERISKAAQRVGDLGVPGFKYGMDLNGYYGGAARLPFLPLTADLKAQIEQLLSDIRN